MYVCMQAISKPKGLLKRKKSEVTRPEDAGVAKN